MQFRNGLIYQVFFTKVLFNLKAEASRTYLGYVWWILEPALYVLVLYVVFGMLINQGTDQFVAFLLCGTIPFLWFSKTVANSAGSIMDGHGLISARPMPKAFFPMVVIAQDCSKQFFVFLLLLAFLTGYGIPPGTHWLLLIPIVLTQMLLIVATSLLVASITPFFPDFKFVVPTGTMLLMFGSGLFYDYKAVMPPDQWSTFLLNPMASLIQSYRQVLLEGLSPDWSAMLLIVLGSLLTIVVTLILLRRLDSTYARLVIQ